jgi:hypothetical protein
MANDPKDDDNVIKIADKKSLFGEKYQQPEAPPNINSTSEAIAWLNTDHFKTYLGGKFKVVRENPDGTLEIMEKRAFIDGSDWMRLQIKDEKGNIKSTPITELWLKSQSARYYKYGFDFDCSAPGNRKGKYNLFKGWKIKPMKGDVARWETYLKEVFCKTDVEFKYLSLVIADMFKQPHKKPGVVVAIRGDEGVGKSFLVERLCDLAAPYYFKTSNPSYVFGDHNSQLKDKLLLHLEEAVWPGGKKTESLFKDLVTGRTIEIDEKFVPLYSVPNHLHLFITGNPD